MAQRCYAQDVSPLCARWRSMIRIRGLVWARTGNHTANEALLLGHSHFNGRTLATADMRHLLLIIVLPALCLACLAQAGKVETLGSPTDSGVPAAIIQVLDSQGTRL